MSKYLVQEQDLTPLLAEFAIFCRELEQRQPVLSKKKAELGKKDLFTINSFMTKPQTYEKATNPQGSYPTINLFFYLAVEGRLFEGGPGHRLEPSPALDEFRQLNPFAQYMYLFETYWNKIDLSKIVFAWQSPFEILTINSVLGVFRTSKPNKSLVVNVEPYLDEKFGYHDRDPLLKAFLSYGNIIHQLHLFGFWEYQAIAHQNKKNREVWVKSVTPSAFGVAMTEICLKIKPKKRDFWEEELLKVLLSDYPEELKLKKEPDGQFLDTFSAIFPHKSLEPLANFPQQQQEADTYIFKVSLSRNTWRKIEVSSTHTLEDLHRAIQLAFSFDDDHLYAFYLDGKKYSRNWDQVYNCPRSGDGNSTADAIIGQLGLQRGQIILYLFDFGDEWEFSVKLEEVLQKGTKLPHPKIIEFKGEAPEQYPDFF